MGGWSLKVLFGTITFVFFLGFLFVKILASGGTTTAAAAAAATTSIKGSFKQFKDAGRDGPIFHAELDPNYMSNRRIPNGPDPIHNRGAGQSKRPPGRAYP